jgi:hypothetical protein
MTPPVEMTKGRAALPGIVVAEQDPFFITLGGPKAHDSSGREGWGALAFFVLWIEGRWRRGMELNHQIRFCRPFPFRFGFRALKKFLPSEEEGNRSIGKKRHIFR